MSLDSPKRFWPLRQPSTTELNWLSHTDLADYQTGTVLCSRTATLEPEVPRVIASSFLIVLLNCTLMFGGCISCPQFFMMPGAKDCCKAGKCERSQNVPVKKDCQRMPVVPSGGQQVHIDLALSSATLPFVEADLRSPAEAPLMAIDVVEHSPPDLTLLNSSLLI